MPRFAAIRGRLGEEALQVVGPFGRGGRLRVEEHEQGAMGGRGFAEPRKGPGGQRPIQRAHPGVEREVQSFPQLDRDRRIAER